MWSCPGDMGGERSVLRDGYGRCAVRLSCLTVNPERWGFGSVIVVYRLEKKTADEKNCSVVYCRWLEINVGGALLLRSLKVSRL